ncbi:MAG: dTDP-4-dehydrorhamnose 3,5-epimerase [Simkaniaceae bacterium]
MEFFDLSLQGLKLIVPKIQQDRRGKFLEIYRKNAFENAGIDACFLQENHSTSAKGTLRGMHYQLYPGQDKLVRVTSGRIYDVVVDMRPKSKTYKCWQGVYLDDEECKMLFIPTGFAHGFCVLSDSADVHYKVSSYYDPQTEKSFRYDDPEIAISWPVQYPILSERDVSAPSFRHLVHA